MLSGAPCLFSPEDLEAVLSEASSCLLCKKRTVLCNLGNSQDLSPVQGAPLAVSQGWGWGRRGYNTPSCYFQVSLVLRVWRTYSWISLHSSVFTWRCPWSIPSALLGEMLHYRWHLVPTVCLPVVKSEPWTTYWLLDLEQFIIYYLCP